MIESPRMISSQSPNSDVLALLEACQPTVFHNEQRPWQVEVFVLPALLKKPDYDVYLEYISKQLPKFMTHFHHFAQLHELETIHDMCMTLQEDACWSVELYFVNDRTMQKVNAAYRGKDATTDVLTFPLLECDPEAETEDGFCLPKGLGGCMGSILISLDYALDHMDLRTGSLTSYVLERFCHGLLHLHGQHHDTDESYQQVIAFQQAVIAECQIKLEEDAASEKVKT